MDSVLCWILMVVASFGALCNVVSVFIFLKQRFRKAFHQLLMLLAVYDFLVSQLILRMPCICPETVEHLPTKCRSCVVYFGFDVGLERRKASTDEMWNSRGLLWFCASRAGSNSITDYGGFSYWPRSIQVLVQDVSWYALSMSKILARNMLKDWWSIIQEVERH